jgi:hypothetical protein
MTDFFSAQLEHRPMTSASSSVEKIVRRVDLIDPRSS